ncbi:hypothetical protein ACJ8LR_23760 [Serratia sp. CY56810]|nr:hypothetical protein [Serratia plymuthica]
MGGPGQSVDFELTYALLKDAEQVKVYQDKIKTLQGSNQPKLVETPIAVE